jgi:lysophospholipase L1-like esterase
MTSIRRRVLFAVAAAVIAVIGATATLLAVDVYLHGRYQQSGGFNVWGYRGTPVRRKQPGEFRIVVLGGSAAYGYGVTADEAIPAVLERLLKSRVPSPRFTVINLAYNNEGAYSFKTTLEDYRWLDCDLAFLYEGYNDLAASVRTNTQVFRHESPIFRIAGYLPIFPIIFREKSSAMLNGGDAGAVYRQRPKTVFNASLATRAGAGVLDATASIAKSLEEQLGRVSTEPEHHVDDRVAGCAYPWGAYCQSIAMAVEFARADGRQVMVGTQPYLNVSRTTHDAHVAQQAEMRAMLTRRFGADPDVRHVDLGGQVNLEDPQMSFDHMHLTVAGNQKIAAALVEPVLEMAARRKLKTS